jgi:hypothetical protein
MTVAEWNILLQFRLYQVRPAEILFVTARDCRVTGRTFGSAMRRLVERGLVVKEDAKEAYSLTQAGYAAARSPGFPPLAKIGRDGPNDPLGPPCVLQRLAP